MIPFLNLRVPAFATAVMLGLAACGAGAAPPSPSSPPAASTAPKPSTAAVAASPSTSSAPSVSAGAASKPATAGSSAASAAAKPSASMAEPTTKGTLAVVSPKEGEKITSTDIPVQVDVKDFKLSAPDVGRPDKPDEGHIHVMLDGMNMGVLFNFYMGPTFTLPGAAMKPGKHTLIFDLATNTHEDMPSTAKQVNIDYQPASPQAAPAAAAAAGAPEIRILQPQEGAAVGPKFTMQFQTTNFIPSLELDGKPNIKGYGHLHVFVDMAATDMSSPAASGAAASSGAAQDDMAMMSMAGMIGMPGGNSFPVDLSAWPNGKHTLTAELVQNDHTPVAGAKPAMVSVSLQGAGAPA